MAAFRYEALSREGQNSRGTLEAESAKAARHALRVQGLIPLSVEAIVGASPGAHTALWTRRVFSAAQRASWTRQLAGLVAAGLPLERALAALAEDLPSEAQRALIGHVRSEVSAGSSFAKALALYPQEFPAIIQATVDAGEQSGKLGLVLDRLADSEEAERELQSRLLGAALYPAIVSVVALCIVLFLLGYVVPQVAQVFTASKRSLPLLTTVMLGLSGLVRSYGLAAAAFAASGLLVFQRALRMPAVRLRWDAYWLRLPVLGAMSRSYNAARFAATLAMLTGAGVPILKALQSAGEGLANQALRADVQEALTLVREGSPLATALARSGRFPPLLSTFARMGEQTGQLPDMLQRAAMQLGGQVQRRATALATVLEPLLIVAMGMVVMLIVLAVLLPIIEMNQLVR